MFPINSIWFGALIEYIKGKVKWFGFFEWLLTNNQLPLFDSTLSIIVIWSFRELLEEKKKGVKPFRFPSFSRKLGLEPGYFNFWFWETEIGNRVPINRGLGYRPVLVCTKFGNWFFKKLFFWLILSIGPKINLFFCTQLTHF